MACSYNDLRHDAVYSGDFSDITGFDLTLDGKTYSITSEEEDDSRTFGYDGEEITITDVQTALEAVTASGFTDEEASASSPRATASTR